MGLSASQARLLSLTNRQHTVENQAQAYQQRKLLLANNSDAAYKKYINALDNTMLKTIQTSSVTGKTSWINGTLDNLTRNNASSETSGNIFYVQDLNTGKLYMPEQLTYDTLISSEDKTTKKGTIALATALSKVTGTTLEEQARSFAQQFGVVYTKKDIHEDIPINYNNAISNGWDKVLGYATDAENDTVLTAYNEAVEKDKTRTVLASNALGFIPSVNTNGNYLSSSVSQYTANNYFNYANEILGNFAQYDSNSNIIARADSPYTAKELSIIRASLNAYSGIKAQFPKDYTSTSGYLSTTHSLLNITANKNGEDYLTQTFGANDAWDDKTLDLDNQFLLMLNGGKVTLITQEDTKSNSEFIPYTPTSTQTTQVYADVYSMASDITGTTYKDLLSSAGYNSFGDALSSILSNVASSTKYEDQFFNDYGVTKTDLDNYQKYKTYKADYLEYQNSEKIYEYIPSDKSRADQYEQMYMALVSSGTSNTEQADTIGKTNDQKWKIYAKNGYIGCSEERCQNETWVSNMIKNAQVIINTWDSQYGVLSKTSPSLNTKLKQVTDNSRVEEASQEYEAQLELIKQKDSKYDTVLEQLESERTAIETEVESLKDIINSNIQKRFKAFG